MKPVRAYSIWPIPFSAIKASLLSKLDQHHLSLKSMKALLLLIAIVLIVSVCFWWPKHDDTYLLHDDEVSDSKVEDSIARALASTTQFDSKEPVLQDTLARPVVFVSGAVVSPGVYELEIGARVSDAVDAAGGFTDSAEQAAINQASIIRDGQQIAIPTHDEVANGTYGISGYHGLDKAEESYADTGSQATQQVNINTADVQTLDTLPGIGPTTAEKIIAYRKENGPFRTTEELKNVSGIGESKYQDLVKRICI